MSSFICIHKVPGATLYSCLGCTPHKALHLCGQQYLLDLITLNTYYNNFLAGCIKCLKEGVPFSNLHKITAAPRAK